MKRRLGDVRVRWAAIGAAVTVTVGGGGLSVTHAISTNGGSTFVPVAPCRLLDTRPGPDTVGPRSTPLGADESMLQQVTGDNGRCVGVPADATAIALNVTTVGATADSYLTVYPADLASPPLASNLNWRSGDAPTPNKVDVRLSPTGAIRLFNKFGTVNVVADVVGYYQDHNHDDRYYTEAETDARLAGKANVADIYTKTETDAVANRVVSVVQGPSVDVVIEFGPVATETIVTPVSGRLMISKTYQFVSPVCSGGGGARVFLTLDGAPIPSSAQVTNGTSLAQAVMFGITGVVAAGAHSIGVAAECFGTQTAVNLAASQPGVLNVLVLN